ncbi:unnamed protein product, partial [marine sediment metagenome]
ITIDSFSFRMIKVSSTRIELVGLKKTTTNTKGL